MSRTQDVLEVLRYLRGTTYEAPADLVAALLNEARAEGPHVTPRAVARILGRLVQAGTVGRRTRRDGLVVFRAL